MYRNFTNVSRKVSAGILVWQDIFKAKWSYIRIEFLVNNSFVGVVGACYHSIFFCSTN